MVIFESRTTRLYVHIFKHFSKLQIIITGILSAIIYSDHTSWWVICLVFSPCLEWNVSFLFLSGAAWMILCQSFLVCFLSWHTGRETSIELGHVFSWQKQVIVKLFSSLNLWCLSLVSIFLDSLAHFMFNFIRTFQVEKSALL